MSTPNITPELIVVRDHNGEYQVREVDDRIPQLHLSQRYQEMLEDRSTPAQAREFIQRKIKTAEWLIESINQRRSTILKVARAIIDRQREFLDSGPDHIHQLTIQEIADAVDVHVTTARRAMDDKWIQTPHGLFPLNRFVAGGTT